MDGRAAIMRDNEKTNVTKINKEWEVVDSHDCPCPVVTQHIEDDFF